MRNVLRSTRNVLRSMREELLEILYLDSPRPAILITSAMTIALGAMFIIRGEFFGASRAYTYMATLGTEDAWGVFCIVAGVVKVITCLLNKSIIRSRYVLLRFLPATLNGMMMAVWLMLLIGVVIYDPLNPYGAVYSIFTLSTFWTGLRRLRQALWGVGATGAVTPREA